MKNENEAPDDAALKTYLAKLFDGSVEVPDGFHVLPSACAAKGVPPYPLFQPTRWQDVDNTSDIPLSILERCALERMIKFAKTADPFSALKTIEESVSCGFYPPESALRWLAAGIAAYSLSGGKVTLDDALGLSVGPGKPRPPRVELDGVRDYLMVVIMSELCCAGASVEGAAEIFCAWVESTGNRLPFFKGKSLNVETVIKRYKRLKIGTKDELKSLNVGFGDTSPEKLSAEFGGQLIELHMKNKKVKGGK